MTSMYVRGADCLVLVYSINNRTSFENALTKWPNYFSKAHLNKCKVILIGNKADLVDQREVTTEEAAEAANRLGFHFCELSAKSEQDVIKAFKTVAFKAFVSRDTILRMILTKHKPKLTNLAYLPEGPYLHLLRYL